MRLTLVSLVGAFAAACTPSEMDTADSDWQLFPLQARCDRNTETWELEGALYTQTVPPAEVNTAWSGRLGDEEHPVLLREASEDYAVYADSIAISASSPTSSPYTAYSCNDDPQIDWIVAEQR